MVVVVVVVVVGGVVVVYVVLSQPYPLQVPHWVVVGYGVGGVVGYCLQTIDTRVRKRQQNTLFENMVLSGGIGA